MSSENSKPGKPPWKRVVDRVDRIVTPPANDFVRTDLFADIVSTATRVDQRVRRTLERQSRRALHAFNLPAASDIRRVFSQLSSVEARVRDLQERISDQERERSSAWRNAPDSSSRSAATSPARSSGRRTASSTSRDSDARESG